MILYETALTFAVKIKTLKREFFSNRTTQTSQYRKCKRIQIIHGLVILHIWLYWCCLSRDV